MPAGGAYAHQGQAARVRARYLAEVLDRRTDVGDNLGVRQGHILLATRLDVPGQTVSGPYG